MEDEAPRAAEIAELTKGAVYSGLSADVNLIGLINGTYGEGASAVVPVLRRSDSIEPAGTALLRGLTLQGALSPAAVQGLLLLQGALEAGQFVVSDPECGAVTLTVSASDCRVRFTGTEEPLDLRFPFKSRGDQCDFRRQASNRKRCVPAARKSICGAGGRRRRGVFVRLGV